jgi:hypothetical protein
MLSAGDFILAAGNLGDGTFQLSLEFRNLQNSKCLPLADPVTNVHEYGADETGNLGMNVDYLVRLELPSESQDMRH